LYKLLELSQQVWFIIQAQLVFCLIGGYLETGGRRVAGVAIRFYRHLAHGRQLVAQLPGAIQGLDAHNAVFATHLHPTMCHRENPLFRTIANRKRDIGVVISQMIELFFETVEYSLLSNRVGNFHTQHLQRTPVKFPAHRITRDRLWKLLG